MKYWKRCYNCGLRLWCLTPLSTIFSYIVAVGFIGWGNRSTRRKPQTCCKSLIFCFYYESHQFLQQISSRPEMKNTKKGYNKSKKQHAQENDKWKHPTHSTIQFTFMKFQNNPFKLQLDWCCFLLIFSFIFSVQYL